MRWWLVLFTIAYYCQQTKIWNHEVFYWRKSHGVCVSTNESARNRWIRGSNHEKTRIYEEILLKSATRNIRVLRGKNPENRFAFLIIIYIYIYIYIGSSREPLLLERNHKGMYSKTIQIAVSDLLLLLWNVSTCYGNILTFVPSSSSGSSSFCFQRTRRSTSRRNPIVDDSSIRILGIHRRSSRMQTTPNDDEPKTKTLSTNVVIIGSGWAGLTVADTLLQSREHSRTLLNVTILDAAPQVGGLASGWKIPSLNTTTKSVELGIHGFWREYKNTYRIMEKRIGLDLQQVLTPYTPSVLYSHRGRVALAPVLGEEPSSSVDDPSIYEDIQKLWADASFYWGRSRSTSMDAFDPQQNLALRNLLSKILPTPLDLAILSDFEKKNDLLSIADRISALQLLPLWADFIPDDPKSWNKYDTISAETLLKSLGITSALYDHLVSPILHVLPMTPGYDCSAAAALSCFHTFALSSPGAFDVRWCTGSITSRIFDPWIQLLQQQRRQSSSDTLHHQFSIQGNARVTSIVQKTTTTSSSSFNDKPKYLVTVNANETIECDAVVLAVGIAGAQKIMQASSQLFSSSLPGTNLPETIQSLRGVTCVAVRFFFTDPFPPALRHAMRDSPVAVCGPRVGNIPELVETGFCIYDLTRLQPDEYTYASPALEVDFFRANVFVDYDDAEIVQLTIRAISAVFGIEESIHLPPGPDDVAVVRSRNAVSHFTVGSASCVPSSVRLNHGLYICGDWIDRMGHASWSTEKSVVTGKQAATALAHDFNIPLPESATYIVPAAPDSTSLAILRQWNPLIRSFLLPNAQRQILR